MILFGSTLLFQHCPLRSFRLPFWWNLVLLGHTVFRDCLLCLRWLYSFLYPLQFLYIFGLTCIPRGLAFQHPYLVLISSLLFLKSSLVAGPDQFVNISEMNIP